ncbi:MAG: outer membrane protein assembly factor BamE [Pseudomonadota bacterium]
MHIKIILLSLALFVPVLSACTSYKMDIRQGNYVTAEMRDKLKPGMSRQQVRYVLGTPMISDAFHGNRWDYVYLLEQRGKLVEERRLTLHFDGDSLARIDDASKSAEAVPAIKPDVSVPEQPGS